MQSAVFRPSVCLSVCPPSVWPSHSGIMSWGLHCRIPHDSSFLTVNFTAKFQSEHREKRVQQLKQAAELSQRRPRDAPSIWVPWKVSRVLTTHLATFPEICNGLLFQSILRTCVQNLKFVALAVPETIGVLKKFGQSLYTPTLHFLPNF